MKTCKNRKKPGRQSHGRVLSVEVGLKIEGNFGVGKRRRRGLIFSLVILISSNKPQTLLKSAEKEVIEDDFGYGKKRTKWSSQIRGFQRRHF